MKRNGASIIKYFVQAMALFAISFLFSNIIRSVLTLDGVVYKLSESQFSIVIGIVECIIASVTTSVVFYQLKKGNEAEHKQNLIEEARFILKYNQGFIENPKMSEVEELLEKAMLSKNEEKIINDDNRQDFVNYLVYLESLAPSILNDVLSLDNVDNLFAYRFFLAMNNKNVQEDQLFEFPDYYLGCFKAYEKWKNYRINKGLPILQSETSLDKWTHYKAYCNNEITVRPMNNKDNKRTVAKLIYETDPFIYPALLGGSFNAKIQLPLMMKDDCAFNLSNIRIAEYNNKIVGVAVVLDNPPRKHINRQLTKGKSGVDVCEQYFDSIEQYFTNENMSYILCVCVDSKVRGKKVGELLIKNVIKTCDNKNLKLHVLSDNAVGINLYKKHGFEIINEEPSEGYAYKKEKPGCYEMIRKIN